MYCTRLSLFIMAGFLTACASLSDMQQRFAVCSYDHAWEAALEAVKDRAVNTKDKDAGLIVTGWAIGASIGPVASGAIVDASGYPIAYLVSAAALLALTATAMRAERH